MNHVIFGAALGAIMIFLSQILDTEISKAINYYLLIVFFGNASSVIYKRIVLKV